MFATRSKKRVGFGLLLGVLLCAAAAMGGLAWWQRMTTCENDRPPLKWIDMTVDIDQQKQLIDQFQEFADKNGFKVGIAYYTPDHKEFLIDLTRKDVEIVISNSPFDLNLYHVTLHNNDCIHPTIASDIGGLYQDLKSFTSEIPSAIISEEK
jgi:hypothetical protein